MSFYVVLLGATTAVLVFSVVFAFALRKATQLKLLNQSKVGKITFYAVRLEGEDFLFLKDEHSIKYVDTLDDEDEMRMKKKKKKSF